MMDMHLFRALLRDRWFSIPFFVVVGFLCLGLFNFARETYVILAVLRKDHSILSPYISPPSDAPVQLQDDLAELQYLVKWRYAMNRNIWLRYDEVELEKRIDRVRQSVLATPALPDHTKTALNLYALSYGYCCAAVGAETPVNVQIFQAIQALSDITDTSATHDFFTTGRYKLLAVILRDIAEGPFVRIERKHSLPLAIVLYSAGGQSILDNRLSVRFDAVAVKRIIEATASLFYALPKFENISLPQLVSVAEITRWISFIRFNSNNMFPEANWFITENDLPRDQHPNSMPKPLCSVSVVRDWFYIMNIGSSAKERLSKNVQFNKLNAYEKAMIDQINWSSETRRWASSCYKNLAKGYTHE